MRALITRPQEDAAPLAEALSARGIEAQIEPLLTIKPIAGATIDLDGVQAVLFTSANGVRAFAKLTPRRDLPAYAVGDGSAASAKAAGFAEVESAGGDASALASLVCDRLQPQNGILFHAAGSITAGDLAGDLEKAGFTVRRTALYTAEPATSLSPEARMNLTLGGMDMVLLFSPRTAATFAKLWREAGSPDLEHVCALCLSAAVAREVGDLNWRDVFIAERPDLPSLLALVDAELQRKDEAMPETTTAAAGARRDSTAASMGETARESGRASDGDGRPSASAAMAPAGAGTASGGGGVATVLAAAVIAAIVAGGVTVTAPRWQGLLAPLGIKVGSPAGDPAALAGLQQQVAQLQAQHGDMAAKGDLTSAVGPLQDELNKLKEQVQALTQAQAGNATGNAAGAGDQAGDLGPLNDKLAALEKSLTDLQAQVKDQEAAASASKAVPAGPDLTPEVSALKTENQALRDQIAALNGKLDLLSKMDHRVASLESQVAAAPAPVTARQQLATALVLAVGQLRSAMADPQPFTNELGALGQLAAGDAKMAAELKPITDKLEPIAAKGAPTLSQLQASLPSTEIARASEAEQAADAGGNVGWWSRMTHRLAEIVTVRPVGEDVTGDGPLERLARAEAALKAGSLAKAADELQGLQGEAGRRAADWLAGAEARLTLDATGPALTDLAARELVPAGAASSAPASGGTQPPAN